MNKLTILSTAVLLGGIQYIAPKTDIERYIEHTQTVASEILSVTSLNAQNKAYKILDEGITCVQETGESESLKIFFNGNAAQVVTVQIGGREVVYADILGTIIVNTDLSSFSEDITRERRQEEFTSILEYFSDYNKVVLCIDRNTLFSQNLNSISKNYGYTYTQDWNTGLLEHSEHLILRLIGHLLIGKNGFPLDAIYVKGGDILSEGTGYITQSDHISITANISQ